MSLFPDEDVLFASIEALDTIPRFPDQFIESVLVFGYAWVDSDTGEGIVVAIHPEFRDSNQNPDAWHTHPVQLSSGDGTSSDFCIEELGTSQGSYIYHSCHLLHLYRIAIAENATILLLLDPLVCSSYKVSMELSFISKYEC
jgi:hypothetical protein